MRLFHRKKKESLSSLQGVPDDTFRCDVCRFVCPMVCLCGAVADGADNPPQVYTLCGICAKWLGFEEYRFPQGLCFNFTDEQREKINTLHKELDICNKELGRTAETSGEKFLAGNVEGGLGLVHDFLEQTPNLSEFLRLRLSMSPKNIIDLSDRLTRGQFVARSEIDEVNKG